MASFQFDYGITGRTLYAFLRSGTLIWNGSAFVTYSVADWTDYALPMTEQSGSGSYFGTWPALSSAGTYDFTVYVRSGGSPVAPPIDVLVGSGPLYFGGVSPPPVPPTLPTPAGTWNVVGADNPTQTCGEVTARPDDLGFYLFDVGNLPQIATADGAVIASAVLDAPGLTLTDQVFNTYQAGAWFTGGTDATDYPVTASISLSDGTELNPIGTYRVRV